MWKDRRNGSEGNTKSQNTENETAYNANLWNRALPGLRISSGQSYCRHEAEEKLLHNDRKMQGAVRGLFSH